MKSGQFKPGTVLLESIFMIESASNTKFQSHRYFPPTAIRMVIDKDGKDFNKTLSHEVINDSRIAVDSETATRIVRDQMSELKIIVSLCEQLVSEPARDILDASHQRGQQLLSREISRLKALSKVNANVRKEELDYFENHWTVLEKLIASATPRLDSLRVIICI
jgi:ATP-dependent helicase HepA